MLHFVLEITIMILSTLSMLFHVVVMSGAVKSRRWRVTVQYSVHYSTWLYNVHNTTGIPALPHLDQFFHHPHLRPGLLYQDKAAASWPRRQDRPDYVCMVRTVRVSCLLARGIDRLGYIPVGEEGADMWWAGQVDAGGGAGQESNWGLGFWDTGDKKIFPGWGKQEMFILVLLVLILSPGAGVMLSTQ